MTHRRTRTLLALVGAAVLATACSSTQNIGSGTTVPVTDASTTVPPDTVPPNTDASTTTPPTAVTTAPTVAPPAGGSVLAAPTNLQSTAGGGVTLPAAFTCGGGDPGIPGWVVQDCQQMPSYSDGVTTLVMRRSDDGHYGVAVLFRDGTHLVQRYFAEEPSAGTWSSVVVQLGDYHFDDGAEVWIGYRYDGTGHYLDLDVLDPRPDGSVFLGGLQSLDHGVVALHPGGATVQSAVYGPSDPGCCPGGVLQRSITFSGEQWWIDAGSTYPAASAPAVTGDF